MALHLIDHPLVQHKLSIMRDKNTSTNKFRELLKEISFFMGYEVTRDFPLTYHEIETPLMKMNAPKISGKKVVIAPILRAGLGMVEGLTTLMPSARIGHIGMYRDEETCEPVFYYYKMPANKERLVIVTDPMLATGGSAIDAINRLKEDGYTILSAEQTVDSVMLDKFIPSTGQKYAVVFGNEVAGVRQDVVDASDTVIEIPQYGTKHSLNVSVSVGVVLWHLRSNMPISR